MKERPILFSGPMVRAILEGRKTVTRRVVKGIALEWLAPGMFVPSFVASPGNDLCPYGQPGDRLWVRETWAHVPVTAYRMSTGVQQTSDPTDPDMAAVYRAGWERSAPGRWRPSVHMPRWASRITLEVTDVGLERVQDITEEEARAEGVTPTEDTEGGLSHALGFIDLWDSLRSDPRASVVYGWKANPWVWVVRFRRVESTIVDLRKRGGL